VYDLATQHYGSVDALFALFKTSGVGFKTTLKGGDRLAMDRQNIVNTEYANYFEGSKRRINTYKKVATPGDGIGTWGIEFDFIVS
jgi:hypothetical protein